MSSYNNGWVGYASFLQKKKIIFLCGLPCPAVGPYDLQVLWDEYKHINGLD